MMNRFHSRERNQFLAGSTDGFKRVRLLLGTVTLSVCTAVNADSMVAEDFETMADRLNSDELPLYDTYTAEGETGVLLEAMIVERDARSLELLAFDGFYTDGANLILQDHLGNDVPYSVIWTGKGVEVFGADTDLDGATDVLVGGSGDPGALWSGEDPLWMVGQRHFEYLQACLEEAALAGVPDTMRAAALCVQCLDPDRGVGALSAEELRCVQDRADRSAHGGASLSGGIYQNVPGVGDPDCDPKEPGEGLTNQETENEEARKNFEEAALKARDYMRAQAEKFWELAAREEDSGNRTAADHAYDVVHHSSEAARQYDQAAAAARNDGMASARNWLSNGDDARNRAAEAYRKYVNSGGRRPPLGEEFPVGEDPRCRGGRDTYYLQKCSVNENPLLCLRRLTDAIGWITDGRCWNEPGPDGQPRLVCANENTGEGGGEADPSDPDGTGSGINDGRPLPTGGGGPGRFVDTTPLGGFLIGLCAEGGCPDPAPVEFYDGQAASIEHLAPVP